MGAGRAALLGLLLIAVPSRAGQPMVERLVAWDLEKGVALVAEYAASAPGEPAQAELPTGYRLYASPFDHRGQARCTREPGSDQWVVEITHLVPRREGKATVRSCEPGEVAKAIDGYSFTDEGATTPSPDRIRVRQVSGVGVGVTKGPQWAIEQRVGGEWFELVLVPYAARPEVSRTVESARGSLLVLRAEVQTKKSPGLSRIERPLFLLPD
jgi:hypothetical protein